MDSYNQVNHNGHMHVLVYTMDSIKWTIMYPCMVWLVHEHILDKFQCTNRAT